MSQTKPVAIKTRILHVCSDTNIGGAGRYMLTLLTQPALRQRFDVAVACPEGDLAAVLRDAGILVLTYPGADQSFSWGSLKALISLIRRFRPRVVHTHGSLAGRVAGALTGARVVYTKHGLAAADERAIQVRSPGGLAKRAAVRLFASRIVAVSQAVAKALVASGADPARIVVIPGGVDPEPYADVPPPVPNVIGCLARLEREKGYDRLLEALALLPAEVRLVIGGQGQEGDALRTKAQRLGIANRVTWSGFVPDIPAFHRQIGLFVLASRSEGLGLVLLEAMAAGRPVVATRVGGIPEVVVDGETGLLVPPEEPAALAEAIQGLLAQPALARQMGEAGRERVRQSFSSEHMAAQTVALYEELIP